MKFWSFFCKSLYFIDLFANLVILGILKFFSKILIFWKFWIFWKFLIFLEIFDFFDFLLKKIDFFPIFVQLVGLISCFRHMVFQKFFQQIDAEFSPLQIYQIKIGGRRPQKKVLSRFIFFSSFFRATKNQNQKISISD